jgi:hypothetical protein
VPGAGIRAGMGIDLVCLVLFVIWCLFSVFFPSFFRFFFLAVVSVLALISSLVVISFLVVISLSCCHFLFLLLFPLSLSSQSPLRSA